MSIVVATFKSVLRAVKLLKGKLEVSQKLLGFYTVFFIGDLVHFRNIKTFRAFDIWNKLLTPSTQKKNKIMNNKCELSAT